MRKKIVSGMMLTLLSIGMLTLASNVQPVKSDWTWTETIYIRADGSVDPDTAPISTVDNITYTLTDNIVGDVPEDTSAILVERDNIVVDGAGYTVQAKRAYTLHGRVNKGIVLSYRNNVTLKNVEVMNFTYGIYLGYSNNSFIAGNTVSNNKWDGIHLNRSSTNVLTGNTASNNSIGIRLSSSNSSVLNGNTASNNDDCGIYFSSSNNSVVGGNNISNNNVAVRFLPYSRDNTLYHNNLINNTYQVDTYPSSLQNTWDNGYPSGGNYWSDYTGADLYSGPYQNETGSDDIVDTPYVIDEDNQDNYPLMYPWRTPPPAEEEDEEEVPLWMQWWLWVIVAVVIVALAVAVYFLKKRKPENYSPT